MYSNMYPVSATGLAVSQVAGGKTMEAQSPLCEDILHREGGRGDTTKVNSEQGALESSL